MKKKTKLAPPPVSKRTAVKSARSPKPKSTLNTDFPIVGVGASAGGLEAIIELLSHSGTNSGLAYVIIQHLDPKHESMTTEILARETKMPVLEIEDGMLVEPNHVYVIPPNRNLGLSHGLLKLLPRTQNREPHMPLNFFFQTLADERNEKAIGVILSGTATDGTIGLQVIKSVGGITLVQDPETAKYDGMPRSAIASGVVDFILSPKEIAAELTRIAKHPYLKSEVNNSDEQKPLGRDDILVRIFSLVRESSNTDFSHYKKNTVQRRIARRMLLQKIDDLADYAKFLENNPDEVKALFADILIHVTNFFRDNKVYEILKNKILPKYMKTRDTNLPFRIWVAGCSTGEEVYSLAMTFFEFQDELGEKSKMSSNIRTSLSIFGTDISESALQKARAAVYPESIAEDISKERLRKFFDKVEGGGYRIAKWLRDTCLFSKHDVTRDPPFAKVDLISCRNVLIYFDTDLHKFVLPIFHYALNPDGILVLGKSETVGGFTNLFALADKTNKIYFKKNVKVPLRIKLPLGRYSAERLDPGQYGIKRTDIPTARTDFQRESDRIALSEYAPPSVVINDAMEIVQSRGRTAPFLELSSGLPSLNLFRMAHPELLGELKIAIQAARKKNNTVIKAGLAIHDGRKSRKLSIKVVPLPALPSSKDHYFTIFFEEIKIDDAKQKTEPKTRSQMAKEKSQKDKQNFDLEKRLESNLEYQQSLIEEYETSQEELVSTNEELQSTNEELQSTNEELETAKEELQSANEELTTINDELQTRNIETINLNNDLTNLLASVDIPIVMVSSDGKIRRFTPKAAKILKLIPSDAGRPIGDIKPNIQVPDLDQLVFEVMESMAMRELETQDNQGHWFQLQVRPYRTADNKIDGAVIALIDIDSIKRNTEELKKLAEDLKKAHDDAATIIDSQPLPLLVIDSNHRVKLANEIFYQRFQVSRAVTEGKNISELGSGQWKIPQLQTLIQKTLIDGTTFEHFEVAYEFPLIGRRVMLLSSRRVHLAGSGEIAVLLAIDDVTERLGVAQALKNSEEKYRNLIANAYDGVVIVREDGKIDFANGQIEKIFGYLAKELVNQPIELLVPEHFKLIQATNSLNDVGLSRELIGKRKNGSLFPIEISLGPVKTSDNIYLTAIIRDISDRKEIEKERAQILIKERRANQVKDEFLAMLSHELRTPLTTILAWSQMLLKGKMDNDKIMHGMKIVEQSAKAQGQLINDLLDISRIQAGKLNLTIQEINPAQVIAAAIDSTRSLAANKLVQIETQIHPSIDSIYADPMRLQQILWNLITNSIKFSSKEGKIWISVNKVSINAQEFVQIQVRDNGKGIKPEFVPIIFESFTQVDSSSTRAYGGLGLGLSIVRRLVEMHGGSVNVESPGENQGSTFTVTIPSKPSKKINNSGADEAEAEEAEAEVNLEGLRVLVVEDEANAREIFAVMLQSFGAEVRTAGSVSEALTIFNVFKPDILVSDISMPVEDGYDLIRTIREQKSTTPAIALTANAGHDDIQRALVAGFQHHLAKPVEANKLAVAIARLAKRI
jgi:two-component system CheB/CheR fusion protein